MYYDDETGGGRGFVAGLLLGALLGVGVALLSAPYSGRRTRRRIAGALAEARDRVGERWVDVGDDMRVALRAGRRRDRE